MLGVGSNDGSENHCDEFNPLRHEGQLIGDGPGPSGQYIATAAAYVLHSGDQGPVVRREHSAPLRPGDSPPPALARLQPAPAIHQARRRHRYSPTAVEQQASPVYTAPAHSALSGARAKEARSLHSSPPRGKLGKKAFMQQEVVASTHPNMLGSSVFLAPMYCAHAHSQPT